MYGNEQDHPGSTKVWRCKTAFRHMAEAGSPVQFGCGKRWKGRGLNGDLSDRRKSLRVFCQHRFLTPIADTTQCKHMKRCTQKYIHVFCRRSTISICTMIWRNLSQVLFLLKNSSWWFAPRFTAVQSPFALYLRLYTVHFRLSSPALFWFCA